MPVRATCACGAAYNLKDQYAGQRLGCTRCGCPVDVPALPPAPPVHAQAGDPAFARDLFLLDQRHFSLNDVYTVADKDGAPIMFVERPVYALLRLFAAGCGVAAGFLHFMLAALLYGAAKRAGLPMPALAALLLWSYAGSVLALFAVAMALSPRRHINIYRDERRTEVLLRVKQDYRVPLFTASYTVTDPAGAYVARIYKKRLRNIFRKRWYCAAPDGSLAFCAREDSMILSILRRFLLGFFGLLRTDYVIYGRAGFAGEFNRRMTLQDRYVLDLKADSLRALDRRAVLAAGVLLDTGEGR